MGNRLIKALSGNQEESSNALNQYEDDPTTGMAFSAAYDATKDSKNSKELCTYVGSMLCFVVPEFRKPVEAALKEIGVSLRFVSLPSQAHENNNVDSKLPQLNRFYILVIFGYCIFLLFNARKEVKTKSPVLSDSRVTTEVYNLSLTSHAVGNFKYFYYFSHLCLDSELFLFDLSRFPTLFAVAMELDRGCSALYKYHDISGRQWHKTEAILSLGMKYEYECGVYL
ncbi:transmembrane protein, putative [Medicago truncatula]|uniref:Transmembrane protein, putative n=1 Tax=Medicago truncatula TaxID=3880 RepID=G7IL04_MEDTR|nr:transmembrane protein, putative [Medicago truncatula]